MQRRLKPRVTLARISQMKTWRSIGVVLVLTLNMIHAAHAAKPQIVPRPQEMTVGEGEFELTAKTQIVYDHDDLKPVAEYFAALVSRATGKAPPVVLRGNAEGNISLSLADP